MPWWDSVAVRKFRLHRDMRATVDAAFAEFCLRVGDGARASPPFENVDREYEACVVELPDAVLAPHSWRPEDLLEWVCEGFTTVEPAQWYQYYASRAVVTPTNDAADALNALMHAKLPRDAEVVSRSHDVAIAEVDHGDTYTTEFLNSIQTAGPPPHELRLRSGSLVIPLRNFAPRRGLCNGARLVVETLRSYFLVARIVAARIGDRIEHLLEDHSGNYDVAVLSCNFTRADLSMLPLTPRDLQRRLGSPFDDHTSTEGLFRPHAYLFRGPMCGGHWFVVISAPSCSNAPSTSNTLALCDSLFARPHVIPPSDLDRMLAIWASKIAWNSVGDVHCDWLARLGRFAVPDAFAGIEAALVGAKRLPLWPQGAPGSAQTADQAVEKASAAAAAASKRSAAEHARKEARRKQAEEAAAKQREEERVRLAAEAAQRKRAEEAAARRREEEERARLAAEAAQRRANMEAATVRAPEVLRRAGALAEAAEARAASLSRDGEAIRRGRALRRP
ncbi:unnamed protein product, partial [Prorocentrum cordatum]